MRRLYTLILAVLLWPPLAVSEGQILDEPVRIRLVENDSAVRISSSAPIVLDPGGAGLELKPGTYTLTSLQATPARRRFHLFAKTFQPGHVAEETAYVDEARALGYTPEVITIGRRLQTASGRVLDTRIHWISILQTNTRKEAQAFRTRLIDLGQAVWIQAENVEPGRGFLQITNSDSTVLASFDAPLALSSSGLVEVLDIDQGLWKEDRGPLAVDGNLEFRIGNESGIDVIEILPIETYLRGVLPAEMPWTWELEALKAQAVAARSEIIANLGSRHTLEGFDFLASELSRAYLGAGGYKPATDFALQATRGEVLIHEGRIVQTVFSATCGGWTEDNDVVWFGPANGALRGIPDIADPAGAAVLREQGIREWVLSKPEAYCAHDTAYFRWERSYSEKELRDIINRRHPVGQIQAIELGERGVSGRLKWARIIGSSKTETIHKELPIRRAFGGLPSALFIIETGTGPDGGKTYTLHGAGRGHGVGMCQNGAQGMARLGKSYVEILTFYFSGVEIEKVSAK